MNEIFIFCLGFILGWIFCWLVNYPYVKSNFEEKKAWEH